MSPNHAVRYAETHRPRFVEQLKEFVRFPSVSAQPDKAREVKRCAEWLAGHLRKIGLPQVELIPTGGHPIVYGEWRSPRPSTTVLIYGHYDVQPPEPLNEWHSPPFSPVVRGDDLYGRGASDDKGQMFAHVKAMESYLQTGRALPVSVKCVFEGEEETGSKHLISFISRNRRMLAADCAAVSDMPIPSPDRPAITYAVRGGLSLEMEVTGPERDLHSGLYGGAVHNPLQALCELVGKLHGASGRVAIPGFYDRVRRIAEDERSYLAETGPTDERFLRDARASAAWGESGYSEYERSSIRPALTINGLTGGYQGAGTKGVIPARALAKISFRLVPDQDPHEIEQQLREYIARIAPPSVRVAIRPQSHARPVVMGHRDPVIRAAAFAYRKGFGRDPVFLRCGGTIPVVDTFREWLGIPTVLMGFALPGDRMHAPNEKFHLPNFYNGIRTSLWFLNAMGAIPGASHRVRTSRSEEMVLAP